MTKHLVNILIAILVLLLLITVVLADFAPIGVVTNQKRAGNQKPIRLGDVNNDGKIDETDLKLLQNHLLEINELSRDEILRADMNQDGEVTILDLLRIHRHILGVD